MMQIRNIFQDLIKDRLYMVEITLGKQMMLCGQGMKGFVKLLKIWVMMMFEHQSLER